MTWSGVFPAVTTKMQASGAIDIEATQEYRPAHRQWRLWCHRTPDAG